MKYVKSYESLSLEEIEKLKEEGLVDYLDILGVLSPIDKALVAGFRGWTVDFIVKFQVAWSIGPEDAAQFLRTILSEEDKEIVFDLDSIIISRGWDPDKIHGAHYHNSIKPGGSFVVYAPPTWGAMDIRKHLVSGYLLDQLIGSFDIRALDK
jgi:hypothetical protein